MAKVASIGVAVVAVSNGSGDMGDDGVVGDLVGDEGAVVGVPDNMFVQHRKIFRFLK